MKFFEAFLVLSLIGAPKAWTALALSSQQPSPSAHRVLIVQANPKLTKNLRYDLEVSRIKEAYDRAKYRPLFDFAFPALGATKRDLHRVLLDEEPEFVHFIGHGKGDAGLVFEDGPLSPATGKALAKVFGLCKANVRCVVLNACESSAQAEEIAKHIEFVVGMDEKIDDDAAIEFAFGFYVALFTGEDNFAKCVESGKAAIENANINPEALIPMLKEGPTQLPPYVVTELDMEHEKPVNWTKDLIKAINNATDRLENSLERAAEAKLADTKSRNTFRAIPYPYLEQNSSVRESQSIEIQQARHLDAVLKAALLGCALLESFVSLLFLGSQESFEKEEIILSKDLQESVEQGDRALAFSSKSLSTTVKTEDLHTVLDANKKRLFLPGGYGPLVSHAIDFLLSVGNGRIHAFDGAGEHMYCIFVNESARRVSVFFRSAATYADAFGTMAIRGKAIREHSDILVHKGFWQLLCKSGKYDEVISGLVDLYTRFPASMDFDLYAIGHSLGGALATLFSFLAVSNPSLLKVLKSSQGEHSKPLVCVSIGSPRVGDKAWSDAFSALEKEGKIRHLRVTNHADAIPVVLSKFRHTGVNIHLHPSGPVEIQSNREPSLLSALSFRPLRHHLLTTHWERVLCQEDVLRKKQIGDLYKDAARDV